MSYGVTLTGFVRKTLEVIQSEVIASLKSTISSALDTEAGTPLGQQIGIFCSQASQLWEVAEAVYNSMYPDSASGFSLRAVGSITGTVADAPQPSTVLANVNVDPGTYAIGTLIAHAVGDPTARFANTVEVTNVGILPATVNGVAFASEETGPVRANAGTLTVIAETVVGWNSITNPLDAALGTTAETDTAFRIKREEELTADGGSTEDSVRADLLKVTAVLSAQVLINDTDSTDINGLPPHSIEAVVLGGSDADVAMGLWLTKPVGIQTVGTTTVSITDSQGNAQDVSFSRPDEYVMLLNLDLLVDADTYIGDNALKVLLTDWVDTFRTGRDFVLFQVAGQVMEASGVEDITSLEIGSSTPVVAPVGSNYVIPVRGLATLQTSDITITLTYI